MSAGLQTWMIKAAPRAVEAASALWVAVFTLSIGLGALEGGLRLGGICALAAALVVRSARPGASLR
ncbi:hypothetical protein [Streptomyces sp. NPDC017086]|uniref:hypothetical protein n=1 Tax=Streptomyces sp. NPDC017086 TaxID=3364976 RepID=UPI0037914E59